MWGSCLSARNIGDKDTAPACSPQLKRHGRIRVTNCSPAIEVQEIYGYMFQSTSGTVRRMTPPRRMGAGWIASSLKEGVTGMVYPPLSGVKRESP
jgi:hypothetical protein